MRLVATLCLAIACGGASAPAPSGERAAAPRREDVGTSIPPEPTPSLPAPKLRVLGIAQDAGVPQAACACPTCTAARVDPSRRRHAASLALALPDGAVFLVDATPDLREQLDAAIDLQTELGAVVDSRRPIAGVLLTHAHMGHYVGLAQLGFEAAHTSELPVYATAEMAAFLRGNAPWDQLVRLHEIELHEVTPGEPIDLPPVRVVPVAVPHRAEYTDTVAYRFEGPQATVLYVPDIDPWTARPEPLAPFAGVDVVLVDATFFSGDELPGRDLDAIGHPTVRSTLELLGGRVANASLRVVLIHLNHSNPLFDPESAASVDVRAAGFEVATEGMEIAL